MKKWLVPILMVSWTVHLAAQEPTTPADHAAVADVVRPSLVEVRYTLRFDKGEAPTGGGWGERCPNCGRHHGDHLESFVKEERPLETAGFLLSPTNVLTRDAHDNERRYDVTVAPLIETEPGNEAAAQYLLALVDVTEKHRLGRAVREQERYLRRLVENPLVGIVTCSPDWKIDLFNEGAERLTGRAAMAETLMLALRLTEGADRAVIATRFAVDPVDAFADTIRRYKDSGALEVSATHLRISRGALFVADSVLADIIAEA